MVEKVNLAGKIEKSLPEGLLVLIKKAAGIAAGKKLLLYTVGGIVRDLLLNESNFDLDLVVEGDAIGLAKGFAGEVGGKLFEHPMFNTATVKLPDWKIDFAMARTETYDRPGALPAVKPGTIKTDLFRRDFTINAMAVCLNPTMYGELIDLYGGLKDLKDQVIRVLHEKSFVDDATRIWRAIRYEQRLGFQIEPKTLEFLKRDKDYLKTVGGYRLKHELEIVLDEKEPEKVLIRLDKLGILKAIHPSLKADKWLIGKFKEARKSGKANLDMYLVLLMQRLDEDAKAQITRYLRFPK